jgi:hypothetical protein
MQRILMLGQQGGGSISPQPSVLPRMDPCRVHAKVGKGMFVHVLNVTRWGWV